MIKRILLFVVFFILCFQIYGFKIYIETINGKVIELNVKGVETIGDIKLILQKMEGLLPQQQTLIFEGVFLDEHRTIDDYQIIEGSSLHLIVVMVTEWTGIFSSEWTFEPNWTAGKPDLSTDVNIPNVTSEGFPNPEINSQVDCKDLIIEEGAELNITESGSLFIYGNLTNNGEINTQGEIKAIQELNNVVNEDIAGLGVEITSAARMGNTIVTRGGIAHSVNGKSAISRYYDIFPSNNTELNASLKFHYDHKDLKGNREDLLKLFSSTDGGLTWTLLGGEVDTARNFIAIEGLNQFSLMTATEYKEAFKTKKWMILPIAIFILILILFLVFRFTRLKKILPFKKKIKSK
jgi:hypothetical protein